MTSYRKIYHKALAAAMLLALPASLALNSCTDTWDEHYDALNRQEGTLWQHISTDPSLSNFARVISATGYDLSLGSSQVFTVFAPTNDCFSAQQADSVIALYNAQKASGVKTADNLAIKEFVQNHIALYNYSVSSLSNDSITMMNGKYLMLTPNAISSSPFTGTNQHYDNGVLFTLGRKVDYFPNVFEYLRTDSDLDSLANFLYGYNIYEFDAKKSVAGGIVDGATIYLDSVMVLENDLFKEIGLIASEDSTYWMVTPNNEVWNRLVPEYNEYYNYDNTVNKRDSLQYVLARLALVKGTVFSRTNNTDVSLRDSAMSYNALGYSYRKSSFGSSELKYWQYDHPYAQGGVFSNTHAIACSNGQVMKPETWNFDKEQTFFHTIIVEGEGRNSLKEVNVTNTRDPLTTVNVASSNPFYGKISGNSFVEIVPQSSSSNPSATFYIHNVLSNIGYDIYVVIAPALAGDTLARDAERLPTKFRCTMGWRNQQGQAETARIGTTSSGTTFETHSDVVDTVLVAPDYRFPTCSYNIDPQVTMQLEARVSNSEKNNGTHQRTIRVDCILLKPHREQ